MTVLACKKMRNKTVTVEKNCTGVFLRFDGTIYKVCNIEKMDSFEHGQAVKATFKKIKECTGPGVEPPICFLYFPFEGYIEVKKIE
jgi:hypothetical protein